MIKFFLLLGTHFEFFSDMVLPGIAGAIVLAMIANSLLKHWGYALF
jgi:hypothetical protein